MQKIRTWLKANWRAPTFALGSGLGGLALGEWAPPWATLLFVTVLPLTVAALLLKLNRDILKSHLELLEHFKGSVALNRTMLDKLKLSEEIAQSAQAQAWHWKEVAEGRATGDPPRPTLQ